MDMDLNLARSVISALALAAFLAIVFWAYAPGRRERFERDARLPLDEDGA